MSFPVIKPAQKHRRPETAVDECDVAVRDRGPGETGWLRSHGVLKDGRKGVALHRSDNAFAAICAAQSAHVADARNSTTTERAIVNAQIIVCVRGSYGK